MEQAPYTKLDLRAIREPADALRATIDTDKLGELADSMAAEGLHQPIGVRGPNGAGTYEIVWGHRRFLAARGLHWDTINARVFPLTFDPLLAQVSENLQRADLTPYEEAKAVQRFIDRQTPIGTIARLFRRSRAWAEQRAALLTYPEDIQRAVHDGALSLAVAHLLAEIDHDEYRKELIGEAERTGANSNTAAVWVAHFTRDRALILTNRQTVAEILTARDDYRVVVKCQGCDNDTDIQDTRLLRFCRACLDAIATATHP